MKNEEWFLKGDIFGKQCLVKYIKSGKYFIESNEEINITEMCVEEANMRIAINGIEYFWYGKEDRYRYFDDIICIAEIEINYLKCEKLQYRK